jgi:hypothetical protein
MRDFVEEDCLYVRRDALNEKFVWTKEAREAILKLNRKIFACEKLLYKEFDAREKNLKERETGDDKFLTDYNNEMRIRLKILRPDKNGQWVEPPRGIYAVLNERIEIDHIASMNHRRLRRRGEKLLNWNTMLGSAFPHFKDDFIHYAFHSLYDHSLLAWEDVLKINSISTEVEVDYQRLTDYFFVEQI